MPPGKGETMKQGYLYIAMATVLFSTMEIALKTVSGVFNPLQMTFSRFFIGGLVLLPFALKGLRRRGVPLNWATLRPFAGIGFVGMAVSMSLYQMAVTRTEASVVAVLFSTNPLFVLLFAYLLLGEPIHRRHVIALALDIIGIFFVVDPFHMELSPSGVILSLLACLTFALYGVMGKRQSQRCGGAANACFSFFFGSLELMVLSALTHIDAVASFLEGIGLEAFARVPFFSGYSMESLPTFLYVSVCVTGIGFCSYFLAMERVSANTVSLVFFFKPILAPLLAMVLIDEAIAPNRWIGIVLMLAGSLTNLLPPLIAERRSRLSEGASQK